MQTISAMARQVLYTTYDLNAFALSVYRFIDKRVPDQWQEYRLAPDETVQAHEHDHWWHVYGIACFVGDCTSRPHAPDCGRLIAIPTGFALLYNPANLLAELHLFPTEAGMSVEEFTERSNAAFIRCQHCLSMHEREPTTPPVCLLGNELPMCLLGNE